MSTVQTEERTFIVRLTQLVWLLFGILEALIGLRVLLKLIAANPNSPFAALVYNASSLFVWPFAGLTRTPAAEAWCWTSRPLSPCSSTRWWRGRLCA